MMKKFFTRRKIIVFVVIAVVGAIIFWFASKGSKAPVVTANISELERKTLEHVISVKAPLEGIEKAEVTSPLNYKIIDIRVQEGDLVRKDDVLALLDRDELEKEIEYEENQIELIKLEAQEKIKALQIEYDKALASFRDMEKAYEQNKDLFENGVITEEAFKKTEQDLENLKMSLETYNAVNGKIQLSQAEKKRIEIQEDQLKLKKEELEKVMIKSPIDGTVTRVNVNIGRYAKDTENSQAMFVVENLEKLQMKASVSEFDVGKIKLNQEVEIHSDILGKDFANGRVARISPTAEQKDINTMERVIPVLIDVTERPENLIAGVIATAILPNPMLIVFDVFDIIDSYSMFCTCSLIFSKRFFISITTCIISKLLTLEPKVLISLLASWMMKSSFLPIVPPPSKAWDSWDIWELNLTISSLTSLLSA
jgi:HlyD family secretion protein